MLRKNKLMLSVLGVLLISGVAYAALCSTGQMLYSKYQNSSGPASYALGQKYIAEYAKNTAYAEYTSWQLAVVGHLQQHGNCDGYCPTMQSLQASLGAAYTNWQSKVADYEFWCVVYDALYAINLTDYTNWTNHRFSCSICP